MDWRNPVDALDVSGDQFIAPLDALLVINDINANGSRPLALPRDPAASFVDVSGDQNLAPIDALLVINALNDGMIGRRVLAEGSTLSTEMDVTITLGQESGRREYRFQIDSAFDTSATDAALEDLLAVYLVDPTNPSQTILDRGVAGTALFTLAGTRAEFVPGLVRWDGSVVSIDTTSLSPRDTGLLKFQLLNSDHDSGSRVTIRPLSNDIDTDGSASLMFPAKDAPQSAGPALNMASLAAASNVEANFENVRFNASNGRYSAELSLYNHGAALGRDVVVTFVGLPPEVTLRNPSGTTTGGAPYVNLRNAIGRGGLGSNSRSDSVLIEFDDFAQIPFTITPQVFASTNHAPTLNPIGPLTTSPGGVLSVPLVATDPDGDTVTFAIRGMTNLPAGRLGANGTLEFRPTPEQLGTYQFDVIASDGALETTRSVTLNVLADPVTTTRVSGFIRDVNQSPLAGLKVEIGGVQGLTQTDGSFMLDLGSDPVVGDTLKVRGETFPGPLVYPFIAEKLPFILKHEVYAGVNNVIDRPIYLPPLDVAGGTVIDPMQDTRVRQEVAPGKMVEVFVGAGTLMNQQSAPFTGVLSITEVPVNLTPAALPADLLPDLVVTIQPGEMVFASPAPMTFPNTAGWPAGTLMDLWSINPVTGEFDDVGDMRVNADGTLVETIAGGVRNSSWHFVATPPTPENLPQNKDEGEPCKPNVCQLTSQVQLHSGELTETHELVTYQSLGVDRGFQLVYDSLRADPRPIRQIGAVNFRSNSGAILVASMTVDAGGFTYQVPGYVGNERGLSGGENFWSFTTEAVSAALQADLRTIPTGRYDYQVRQGNLRFNGDQYTGRFTQVRGDFVHVNTINSPFGSGWGLAGLQELIVNADNSVLLVDGDGSQILFEPAEEPGIFDSPSGDFSTLVKLPDGTFRRTLADRSVTSFDSANRISSVRDPNGNTTSFTYDGANRLIQVIDPVGLATTLDYSSGRVSTITDPVGRVTRLEYDSAGNLRRVIDPDGATRTWEYDALHHLTGETDARGQHETAFYDSAGRVTGAIRKDGSTIAVVPVQVQGLADFERGHDFANPATAIPFRNARATYADATGNVINAELDRRGQAFKLADGIGSLPKTTRDGNNQVNSITDARGNRTRLTFDEMGNLTQITRPTTVRLGEVSDAINHVGEIDRYTFEGSPGQRIFVRGTRTFIGNTAFTKLIAPSGEIVEVFATDIGMDQPRTLLESGTYTLEVGGGPTSYTFRVFDVSNAAEIGVGQPVTASLAGDLFYQFEGQKGQRLSITIFNSPMGAPVFRMFGPDGSRLDLTETIPVTLPTDGIYALTIRPGNDFGFANFDFQLNDLSDNTPIVSTGFGTLHSADLAFGETLDVALAGPAGLPILIERSGVICGATNCTADFQLLDETGNDVTRGAILAEQRLVLPVSGNYTARFTGNINGGTASVSLRIQNLDDVPALTTGMPIDGTLQPFGHEIYRFDASLGQRLLLYSPDLDPEIEVGLNEFGYPLQIQHSDLEPFTAPYTGTYYVHFRNHSSSVASFHAELRDVSNLPTIALDTEIAFHLDPHDFPFAGLFSGNAGDRLFFDDRGSSGSLGQWSLTSVAADPNNSGRPFYCSIDSFTRDSFACTLLKSGTYQFLATADRFANTDPLDARFALVTARNTTTPLLFDHLTSGAITHPLESFDYEFEGFAGQRVFYDGRGNTTVSADLLSPLGVSLFRNAAHANSSGPITLTESGTYRMHMSETSNQSGNFSFRMLNIPDTEMLGLGVETSGQGIPADVQKVFRINGSSGQRLRFNSPGSTIPGTTWHLYGPHNEQVASGDFVGNDTGFEADLTTDGTYVLVSFRGSGLGDAPFDYRIVVTDVSDAPVTPSGLGVPMSGVIAAGETHTHVFTASAGTLVFYDEMQFDNSRLQVCIKDPLDNLLACNFEGVRDGDPILLKRSGQYTVTVAGGADDYAFRFVDLRATASPIALGDLVSGTVPSSDSAAFRLNATVGQRIYVDYQAHGIESGFSSLRLFGPDGRLVSDYDGGITIQATGEYYARVDLSEINPETNYRFKIIDTDNVSVAALGATIAADFDISGQDAVIIRVNGVAGRPLGLEDVSGGESFIQQLIRHNSRWRLFDFNFNAISTERSVATFPHTGTYYLINDSDVERNGSFAIRVVEPPMVTQALDIQPPSTILTYDATFNELTSRIDELGRLTVYEVDPANGNRLSSTQVVGAVGGPDDVVTRYTYTPQGMLDTVTDPLGRVRDYDYDARGRLIRVTEAAGTPQSGATQFEYDEAGNITAMVDPNNHRSELFYDLDGRVTLSRDAIGNEIRFAYDAGGLLTSVTDARGNVTRAEYDAMGRRVRLIDPAGNSVRYTYDAVGNVTSVTDPLGRKTEYRYDARKRLIEEIDPAGGVIEYAYDADDNLTQVLDPLGNSTRYEYDSRSRLARQVDALSSSTTYAYDLVDQLTSKTDQLGRRTEFEYDDAGRLAIERWLSPSGDLVNQIDYAYDAAGNLTHAQDGSSDLEFTYDALNRVVREQANGGPGAPSVQLDYVYNASGDLLSVVDTIQGQVRATKAYTYDTLHRVTRIVQTGEGIATKRVDFAYNANSQVSSLTRMSDEAGSAIVAASSFAYDQQNRIESITHRNAANSTLASFHYQFDAASRITQIAHIDGTTNYTYDARNQLTGAITTSSGSQPPPPPAESYNYDAIGNRVASHLAGTAYVTGDGNRVLEDDEFAYEYDAAGNLVKQTTIASGAVREFAWDHRNRLSSVTDRASAGGPATQTVTFAYDLLDRRIALTVSSASGTMTTHFINDGLDVLADWVDPDGPGVQPAVESMRYMHGPAVDQILAQEDAFGDVLWDLTDHLGSVRDLVDNTGAVVNHLRYDAFGNVLSMSSSAPQHQTRYQFTGREYDSATGLHYYRARYYDAVSGRFISEDPYAFDGRDANFYRYVGNQPVVAVDFSGNVPLAVVAGVLGYPTGFVANLLGQLSGGTKFEDLKFGDANIAGLFGSASAATLTFSGAATGSAIAVGAVFNTAQYLIMTDYCKWNVADASWSALTGAIGGKIGGVAVRAVPGYRRWTGNPLTTPGRTSNISGSQMRRWRQNRNLVANIAPGVVGGNLLGATIGALPRPGSNCGCREFPDVFQT